MDNQANTADIQAVYKLIQQGQLDKAQACGTELCQQHPRDAQIWFLLGIIYGQLDQYDMAASSLQRSIKLMPNNAEAHHFLGTAQLRKGQLDAAVASYEQAILLNPKHVRSYQCLRNILTTGGHLEKALRISENGVRNCPTNADLHCELSKVLSELGRKEDAIDHLNTACRLDPAHSEAKYFLAGLSGEHSASKNNQSHITEMFDRDAEHFDQHLTQGLEYKTPAHIYSCVEKYLDRLPSGLDILDLGCGTGLAGILFKPVAHRLTGIDLSGKMIEKARQNGVYDELFEAELNNFLQQSSRSYDLILSTDVFVYVGALDTVFTNIAKTLNTGGLFSFSVEATEDTPFRMQSSGRYSHSESYILELAARNGFSVLENKKTVLRKECFQPIKGRIFVLHLPDKTSTYTTM